MSPLAATSAARVAQAASPILNRVVLAGAAAVELVLDDHTIRLPGLNFAADSVFQLLSTSMIDRLGMDLQKAGFARVSRTDHGDRWRAEPGVELELVHVQTDAATPLQLSLEYATLLTHTFKSDDAQHTIRCATAPALLALDCASFDPAASAVLESEELERVVTIIAARRSIEAECGAAPAELRGVIVPVLAALAASDALPLLIRRALPDSLMLPAVGKRVRDRITRMAC